MYDQQQIPISEEDYQTALAEPLTLTEEQVTTTTATTTNNSYFDDALFEQVTADIMAKENCTKEQAQNIIYKGGLSIYSTEDPFIQSAAESIMLNTDDQYFAAGWREEPVASLSDADTPVYNDDGTLKTGTAADGSTEYYRKVRTEASMVCMNYSGEVLGLVGGLGEKTTDLALNRAYDVPRQTGSTMKPIGPYCLGIEYGLFNWSSMLNDSPLYTAADMKIRDDDYCQAHGLAGLSDAALQAYPAAWRDWPSNYSKRYTYQDTPLYYGLAQSMNTIAARVGDAVGYSNIYDFVRNTLQLSDLVEADDNLAPMILGGQSYGVTTVQLCAAYQIFNNGTYTTPHLYTEIYDASGNLYLEADTTSYQALTEQTATIMNRLMRNVLTIGTAAGYSPVVNGTSVQAVGKTGTASDWKDYSFVGLTPSYVAAVWWGYDTPFDMKSTGIKALASNTPCKNAWRALMQAILVDTDLNASFPMADGVVQASYCTESGLLATASCPSTAVGYYNSEDMPASCDYPHTA
jgi:penicillin-binding protein 1A